MKQSPRSQEQKQSEENTPNKIKAVHVFNHHAPDDPLQTYVKPALIVNDADSIELSDELLDDNQKLEYSEPATIKKTSKKSYSSNMQTACKL